MKLVWLGVLILLIGVIAVAIVVALLAAWRNYNRRDGLVDKGRQLRQAQRGDEPETYTDTWREAGQRYRDADEQ